MGTGDAFPGKARPGRDADHSRHLMPKSRMSMSYTPLPQSAFVACSGTALAFSLIEVASIIRAISEVCRLYKDSLST
jgi:hypothetical protein